MKPATIAILLLLALPATAATYEDKLLDAIHRQENSRRHPYGICDGHRHTEAKAREICRRTVRHAYADWLVSRRDQTFLDFLADRYCPEQCDPAGNRHWKRNLPAILKQP